MFHVFILIEAYIIKVFRQKPKAKLEKNILFTITEKRLIHNSKGKQKIIDNCITFRDD